MILNKDKLISGYEKWDKLADRLEDNDIDVLIDTDRGVAKLRKKGSRDYIVEVSEERLEDHPFEETVEKILEKF